MARETIAMATASPSRAAWKTVTRGQLGLLSEELREHRIAATMHRRPGIRLNGAGGKHRLEAAAIAAGADGAMGVHGEVADVAGHAGMPAQRAPADRSEER